MYLLEYKNINNLGRVVDETIKGLVEKNIIYNVDEATRSFVGNRYRLDGTKSLKLYQDKLILNNLLGFEYIIEKYKTAVLKIENIDYSENYSIGSGFLTEYCNNQYLVTNRHVIEKAKKINVFDIYDNEILICEPIVHPTIDLAIIKIIKNTNYALLKLNSNINILSEIITIGYPKIPMTRKAYQVCHKGEVNSFVKCFQNNEYFLISAKTSAGNSGSPVINELGTVVGIVAQEFFEKNALVEKGVLPYYAAISSNDIFNFIKKNNG